MFEQNEQCIELFRRERHFAPFFKKNAFRDVRPENAKFVEAVSLWFAHRLSEVFQKNLTAFQGFLKDAILWSALSSQPSQPPTKR